MLMRLDPADNVAVILADGQSGQTEICGDEKIVLLDDIPFGHKCALIDISQNEKIYKYGCAIGYATENIKKGMLVRENNMKGLRGRGDVQTK